RMDRRVWGRPAWLLLIIPLLAAAPLSVALGPLRADTPAALEQPAAAVAPSVLDVPPAESPVAPPVLVGAGDIAACGSAGSEATAALLDRIDGTVVTLGDNAYSSGTSDEYAQCYGPTWGRHKLRTRPAPGNHDYATDGAAPYFAYFGDAGDSRKGYYSYALGTWHIVVVNSNCAEVGGCQAGSPQERWLRDDLAAHPAPCTLA